MFRRSLQAVTDLRTRFLAGPVWMHEPLFVTRLTRFYRSAAIMLFYWCMAWYERMLSRPARLLLIVFLVTSFVSSLSVRGPAQILFLALLTCAVADFLIGLFFLPRLNVKRQLPHRAVCGVPCVFRYSVENRRKHLPALDLLAEPYTGGREWIRTDGLEYFQVPAKETREITVRFTPRKRGLCRIPCAMTESSFPFNIFKHAVRNGGKEELLVHPWYTQLRNLFGGAGADPRQQTARRSLHTGDSLNFQGCREYQNGDPPRRIHWIASAGKERLIVKEFQKEQKASAALLVDTWDPDRMIPVFSLGKLRRILQTDLEKEEQLELEGCCSLAASLAYTLTESGIYLSHFALGRKIHSFRLGGSPAAVMPRVLDSLAYAVPLQADPIPSLKEQLHAIHRDLEEVYLVLLRYDESVKELLAVLEKSRIRTTVYLVAKRRNGDIPDSVTVVSPDVILRGMEGAR